MADDKHGKPSDHLANERTFLAWIRTGIALMGFGFVVVKFSLFTRQLTYAVKNQPFLPSGSYSSAIGITLVVLGALSTLLAYIRYHITQKELAEDRYGPSNTLPLLLAAAIALISVMLSYYLWPSI